MGQKKKHIPAAPFIFTAILAISSIAGATQKEGFSSDELKGLLPLLEKMDSVGYTAFDSRNNPRSITLATRINARRETVLDIFKDPANFYYVSTLFKENLILDRHDNAMAWTWASRHRFFSVTGKNSIALYPPRRADVEIEESSMGRGRFKLLFLKDGKKHTVMILSGFMNVESSEWLIKFLVGGNPSMKQAMNIAIGLVVVKGTRTLAERLERGKKRRKHSTRGKTGGPMSLLEPEEIKALLPVLKKGQVFMCDSHKGGRLRQATVMERVDQGADDFEKTVSAPHNYAKKISAINSIVIHEKTEKNTLFSWKLGFSIFGLSSKNILAPRKDGVLLSSVGGDLEGAKWRWQIVPQSKESSLVLYHAYANPARTSVILDTTINREPYLEHGLVMGSNIVMMKAMREIAQKEADK